MAYLFLRRLENPPQSINDEQTQTLPSDEATVRGWRGRWTLLTGRN
ncbi:hypothetical protein ACLK17_18715 [Escherichia coli]